MGQAWQYVSIKLVSRRKLGGTRFKAIEGKKLARIHLNQ
jgi:hypothetical protein